MISKPWSSRSRDLIPRQVGSEYVSSGLYKRPCLSITKWRRNHLASIPCPHVHACVHTYKCRQTTHKAKRKKRREVNSHHNLGIYDPVCLLLYQQTVSIKTTKPQDHKIQGHWETLQLGDFVHRWLESSWCVGRGDMELILPYLLMAGRWEASPHGPSWLWITPNE